LLIRFLVKIFCVNKSARLLVGRGGFVVLEGYCDSVSAEAVSYFVVYSGVASSVAAMPYTLQFPVRQVPADQLRVAGDQVEGQLGLGGVKLSDEVEKSFSNADALIIRQNHQS
jgi:hypothetical protein